ncbi:hypothetical protein Baya_13928 [Bagarius yarrelli]|uniref:Uncharacterized protein n=1 Tax=Bagarius yarrelli TaxID=175774 RepID=A0A556V7C0_BAGYA|nr:hypothetical protein Baya_13928 [Bagarius yarrelli]
MSCPSSYLKQNYRLACECVLTFLSSSITGDHTNYTRSIRATISERKRCNLESSVLPPNFSRSPSCTPTPIDSTEPNQKSSPFRRVKRNPTN